MSTITTTSYGPGTKSQMYSSMSRAPSRYSTISANRRRAQNTRSTVKRTVTQSTTLDAISRIDYGDAYLTPDNYYVKDSRWGKVYSVRKPKHNLMHVNGDPTLGGTTFNAPSPPGPCCSFNEACAKTPLSTYYTRIIPWDAKKGDFVYGAVQDSCFKGFYDRRSLKSKVDMNRSHWDPVRWYNLFWLLCLVLIVLAIIIAIICAIVWWDDFKQNWTIYLTYLLVMIAVLFALLCICRCGANIMAKRRFMRLDDALQDVNRRNLYGTGTYVYPGDNGAWIEVEMDPRRTAVSGPPREDSLAFNMDKTVGKHKRVVKRSRRNRRPRQRIIEETTTVRSGAVNVNGISTIKKSAGTTNLASAYRSSGYERLSGNESVYKSNYKNSRSNSPARGGMMTPGQNSGHSPRSAKKMSFYDKIRNSKMSQSRSGFVSNFNSGGANNGMRDSGFMTPVNAGTPGGVGNIQNSFARQSGASVTSATGPALNLMAQSPRR